MMRSIPLRGFDQQIAENICTYMQENGTKFIRGAIPAGGSACWGLRDGGKVAGRE
jgi:hypothetical protein